MVLTAQVCVYGFSTKIIYSLLIYTIVGKNVSLKVYVEDQPFQNIDLAIKIFHLLELVVLAN